MVKKFEEFINEGLFSKKLLAADFAKAMRGTWHKEVIDLVPEDVDGDQRTWTLMIRKWKGSDYANDKNGDPLFENDSTYLSFIDKKTKKEYFSEGTMSKIYDKVCKEVRAYNMHCKTAYKVPKMRF